MKPCPIYAVGQADATQCAMRDDGVWFIRRRNLRMLWGAWERCKTRPYEFGTWVDKRAGNAQLPGDDSHAQESDSQ